MVKTTVKISSDESGRPTIINVKGYNIKLNYNANGIVYSVDFSGKTPSLSEMLSAIFSLTSHIPNPVKVKTENEDNILIDLQTQSNYLCRGSTLKNDNGVHAPNAPPLSGLSDFRGKYFPRGCRGFLKSVSIYCKRTAAGTLKLNVAPQVGMGAIKTVTITPSSEWDWQSADVNLFWNYDSMFIWTTDDAADILWGYDQEIAQEWFASTDSGVTWLGSDNYRIYIRAVLGGQTVGDVAVSGTVNNVEIPTEVTRSLGAGTTVVSGAETSILTLAGSGTLKDARIYYLNTTAPTAGGVVYRLHIYIDGLLVYRISNIWLTQSHTATSGRNSTGEFVQGDGESWLSCRISLPFKQKIELKAQHSVGVDVTAVGELTIAKAV